MLKSAHPSNEIWIGDKADIILSNPGVEGMVLASVTGAVYFKTANHEIMWMAGPQSPMHARCIRLVSELPPIDANASFRYGDRQFIISTGTTIELNNFHRWQEIPPLPAEVVTASEILSVKDQLISELMAASGIQGFGSLIRNLQLPMEPEPVQPVLKIALPILRTMKNACQMHDLGGILKTARKLIGLGDGLTPSGDDFLGGLFFSFFTLNLFFQQYDSINRIEIELFLENTRSSTNEISRTLLSDMAHGSAIEPLSDLLYQILRGHSPGILMTTIRELSVFGHSTGWDMLTGVLLGLCWLQTS
jgi:hypothetical protein